MPAQGRGANLPPPKAPAPTWGPLRSGYVPSTHVVSQGPAPKVQPKAPATKPERTLFTGLGQRTIPNVKQPQLSRSEQRGERQWQKTRANELVESLSRSAAVTGRINPNLIFHDTGRPNMAYASPGTAREEGKRQEEDKSKLAKLLLGDPGREITGQSAEPNVIEKAYGLVRKVPPAFESTLQKGIQRIRSLPGFHGGMENLESLKERRESAARLGTGTAQALEIAATGGLGLAGRAGAAALEARGASKLIESGLQSREALGLIGGKAPETAPLARQAEQAVAQTGARAPSVASRALKLGAGSSAAYGKLLTQADIAKAGVSSTPGEPKPHESFAGHLWRSITSTIANLPAAVVETPIHPVKTLKGLAKVYSKPEEAFHENPFGTILAFAAPASGLDRAAGGILRRVSKNKVLPLERPDLAYRSGSTMPRQYQPGIISGTAQRIPDAVMKRLGKGERPMDILPAALERTPTAVKHEGVPANIHDTSVKGLVESGRVRFRHTKTQRGYVHPEHDFALEPVGGKRIQGKDYRGRPKPFHYDPEVAKPVERESTVSGKKETHFILNPGWHDSGSFQDVAKAKPGVIYRGISRGEWEAIQKSGAIKSNQEYNIANEPGTLWSRDPGQAMSYASGFAPNHLKPGFEQPGYVIAIREPEHALPNRGNEKERIVPGHTPVGEIISAYEVRPSSMKEGDIRLRREATDPGYRHGGGGMPSAQYAFREVKTPTDITPERVNSVHEATKLQERRDILGSRLGGWVRSGQIDFLRNNERVGANLGVMEANHFLTQHLPHDEAHAIALMTFHQGEAVHADTFWEDVAHRQAELKDNLKKTTGTSRGLIQQQIDELTHMEQHRSSISHEDLLQYEKSAGEVASRQAEGFMQRNKEGIGEPGQLAARDALALHIHGHHMGRGQLRFNAEPGPSLLAQQRDVARKTVEKADQELHDARVAVNAIGGKPGPIRTGGVKSGPHFELERAQEKYKEALLHRNDLENKLTAAVFSKAVDPHGNKWPGFYDAAGEYVTPAERAAFIKEHFGREMGFLTHKEPMVGTRSMVNFGPRTMYPMRTVTTGPLGTYDRSPAALRNHFEREARNLATLRGHRAVGEHLALMDEHGNPFTEANAKRAADNLNATREGAAIAQHLGKWVPHNFGAEKVASLITGHPYTKVLEQMGRIEHKAMLEERDKAATFGLLPEKVQKRLDHWETLEHNSYANGARMMTTPWRQTNLYTSVRWPFGTTQENAVRLAAHMVSPLVVLPYGKYTSISFGTGSHIPRMLEDKINDPNTPYGVKQQALFQRALYGTGNLVGSQLHELEPALHKLSEDSFWGKIAENPLNKGLVHTNRKYGPINPGDHLGWRPYRKAVGGMLNKMETNAKTAAGGKLALNDANFFDKFRKINREQAAQDYVDKITSDPGQSIKAAQDLLEVMGNWMHLTPTTRGAQMVWAPFALWWLNSAKFIFKTLPRDHPYATGLLAAMTTATGTENRNLKEYLEGTIPFTMPFLGKINLNPVHYSPFDVANDPLAKAGSMVLPQVTEPVDISKGIDSLTGEKFEGERIGEGNEGTTAARLGIQFLESYIPGLRLASQITRQGGQLRKDAAFPWDIKKGTGKGYDKALAKALLPFMYTYQSKAQKAQEESEKETATVAPEGGRSSSERPPSTRSERAAPERKGSER